MPVGEGGGVRGFERTDLFERIMFNVRLNIILSKRSVRSFIFQKSSQKSPAAADFQNHEDGRAIFNVIYINVA